MGIYIIWSLVLSNKNVPAFGRQKKNKKPEMFVGVNSDKNVLKPSSKPIEVSDITEQFLRTSASSAKPGKQRSVK